MRYDIDFNYDYLIKKIEDRYTDTTFNKKCISLCKEVYYFTPLKLRHILKGDYYFTLNEVYKISKVLDLTPEEINKCFFTTKDKDNK